MRVLFATTAAAGHFRPLVPFAEACRRAGHDVLMAGQAGAAPAAERAGFAFQGLAEPDEEEVARYQAGQVGLSSEQAMGRAPFNARRVAELGAAIALDGGPASLPALGQAVPELLSDARYRNRASAIAKEIQTLAPVDEAPNALSALAEGQLPSA